MLRNRFLAVVLAGAVALVACGDTDPGNTTSSVTSDSLPAIDDTIVETTTTSDNQDTTSTTTAAGSQTTTTYVTSNTNPRITELIATPESGRPGDPLTICGFIGPGITVSIGVGSTTGFDAWPDSEDHHVTADDQGHFCWEGVFPEQLEVSHGPNANELYPTPPGRYEISAQNKGFFFAHGELEITE